MRPAASIALALGLALLGAGIFSFNAGPTSTAVVYVAGITLTSLALASFIRTGWHGSGISWLVASPTAAILTWTLYELIRQGVPLYGIGILGEMTAPAVSFAVAAAILVVGWLRTSRFDGGAPGHPVDAAADLDLFALAVGWGLAAYGLVVYQAWWTIVFALGGIAASMLVRRRAPTNVAVVAGVASAFFLAIGMVGVFALFGSLYAGGAACLPEQCSDPRPGFLALGLGSLAVAVLGLRFTMRYARRSAPR